MLIDIDLQFWYYLFSLSTVVSLRTYTCLLNTCSFNRTLYLSMILLIKWTILYIQMLIPAVLILLLLFPLHIIINWQLLLAIFPLILPKILSASVIITVTSTLRDILIFNVFYSLLLLKQVVVIARRVLKTLATQ